MQRSTHQLIQRRNCLCIPVSIPEMRGCIPTMLQEQIFIAAMNLRQSNSLMLKPHHVHGKIIKQKLNTALA